MRNFDELIKLAAGRPMKKVAVAAADDRDVLEALLRSQEAGIAEGIFVGNKDAILQIAEQIGMDIADRRIIDVKDRQEAARRAVALVRAGEAEILMKGFIQTGDLLRAVLDKENGLRTGRGLSHVAVVEAQTYDRLFLVSDGGFNIAPDLPRKIEITQNAVDVAQKIGYKQPRVAILAALEIVNPDMPATLDAALISKAAERGQIKGAIVDGPLAMDLALSKEAAEHKKVKSQVAGEAEVLIVPNIESGNILIKGLQYAAGATWGGLVVGALAPIILVSRADNARAKMISIALGQMVV